MPRVAVTEEPPMKVVFFVVDGAGIGIWSIAQYQSDNHPIRQFPVVGLVDTRAATGYSPGSAAAATSFATGIRSFVRAIGVGPDSQPRESVLEVARQRGLATGLVTTARITDATPASFSTHTAYRDDEPGIALQQLDQNLTVFMGGGRMHFAAGGRPDSLDLIGRIREHHTYVENGDQLGALALDSVTSLYGLFEWSDMPVYPIRSPSLTEMTNAALQVLDKDPDGFFLLLETENTDTELHHDVEFDVLAGEMVDVADAIRTVFDYQRSNPETLFILLGDHDTGGLAVQSASQVRVLNRTAARLDTVGVQLGESAGLLSSADLALADSTRTLMRRTSELLRRRSRGLSNETMLVARYTTGSHTANLVPLFAKGPGAELFSGVIDNHAIGQILLDMVGRKLEQP
jgi:alkaline phosphatase